MCASLEKVCVDFDGERVVLSPCEKIDAVLTVNMVFIDVTAHGCHGWPALVMILDVGNFHHKGGQKLSSLFE